MIKILQELKRSLPWIMLVVGVVFLGTGEFINFASSKTSFFDFSPDKITEFITGLGKVILISGVTTVTLDSYKFLGIFK